MKKILFIIICSFIIVIISYFYITQETGTTPIWQKQYDFKVYSNPIYADNHSYFIGGNKGKNKLYIYELNTKGEISAISPQLPSTPYTPIYAGYRLILADISGMLRAFSVPDLKVIWELSSEKNFKLEPLKIDENKIAVVGAVKDNESVLFCIDANNGETLWDISLGTPVKNYGASKDSIVCIQITPPSPNNIGKFCATCINVNTGTIDWRIQNIENATPLLIEDICILTAPEGKTIIVDRKSGNIMFTNPQKGYKLIQICDNSLVTYKEADKQITVTSLYTGNEWNLKLEKTYKESILVGSVLVIADKSTLQGRNLSDGSLVWKQDFKDIYNLYSFRDGVFLTHKDYFTSRTTYGRFINANNGSIYWTAIDTNLLRKPVEFKDGDFLISYDGLGRLMPYISGSGSNNDPFKIQSPQIDFTSQKQNKNSKKSVDVSFPEIKFDKNNIEKNQQTKPTAKLNDERETEW